MLYYLERSFLNKRFGKYSAYVWNFEASHRYMWGQYLVDVAAQYPQGDKVWLVQNGFVKTLETHGLRDMAGLPHVIINSYKNLTIDADIYLRIKFYYCPPLNGYGIRLPRSEYYCPIIMSILFKTTILRHFVSLTMKNKYLTKGYWEFKHL